MRPGTRVVVRGGAYDGELGRVIVANRQMAQVALDGVTTRCGECGGDRPATPFIFTDRLRPVQDPLDFGGAA